ncbi:DUF4426 domain-containing protein [Pseudidiomarina mangrovi]|uniref:DUF4426 domain-containing protein n=1 Tax=Pseudidiomarina mangrovi TaxID=2487133 RepID=UPI000FCBDF8D|nr:DUF4426 domain-containing protein [Pseudidiomarina mangrovi]CAI8168034.1 MAG: Uncharacterised protein [Pseudidiomarina mangrovi]
MKNLLSTLLLLSSLLFTQSASAQQAMRLGPWEVHYNAFNSTLLRAEMAQQYDLQRSSTLATLNITVLAADEPGKPAQKVTVTGYSMNPLSQQQRLDFNQVIEGDAVYYLAQVRFTNLETLRFFITIDDGKQQQTLRFHKEFWAN